MDIVPVWMPESFPGWDAAQERTPVDPYTNIKMAQGVGRRRRIYSLPGSSVQVTALLTRAQMDDFFEWYEELLVVGALPFIAPIVPLGEGALGADAELAVAWFEAPPKLEPKSGLWWLVSTTLRIAPDNPLVLTSRPYPIDAVDALDVGTAQVVGGTLYSTLFDDSVGIAAAQVDGGVLRSLLQATDAGSEGVDISAAQVDGGTLRSLLNAYDIGIEGLDTTSARVDGGVLATRLITSDAGTEGIDISAAQVTGGTLQ